MSSACELTDYHEQVERVEGLLVGFGEDEMRCQFRAVLRRIIK